MSPEISNKYLIIQVQDPDLYFDKETLCTVWVDKAAGIQEVIGRSQKTKKYKAHSYLFDKDKFTLAKAKAWLREKKKDTTCEALCNNKVFAASDLVLCQSLPKISMGSEINRLTESDFNQNNSSISNTKYFFYVEGVHSGFNLNDHYFYKEELTKSYKSASYALIDWEHETDQIIGMSLDSELISKYASDVEQQDTKPEPELALAFNGILHRMSPFMQAMEGEESRDDIIKRRFFEGKLALSMECYFDRIKCTACSYETSDWIDFEFHRWSEHSFIIDSGTRVGMGLIGITFVGWGVVESPADVKAYVEFLRTSDDGLIEDMEATDALQEKHNSFAYNFAAASYIEKANVDDLVMFGNKNVAFASEKISKTIIDSTKNKNNNDNKLENLNSQKTPEGGNLMPKFNLVEKCSSATDLNSAFVIAQTCLRDYQGDKALNEESQTAFVEEIDEVIKSFVSKENYKVADIFTLTDSEKLDSITSARDEEKKIAKTASDTLQTQITTLTDEKAALEATITKKETEIETLKNEKIDNENATKVSNYIDEVKQSGIVLDETLEKAIREVVSNKLDDPDELVKLKRSLIASAAKSKLVEGSEALGETTGAGEIPATDLDARLTQARKKYEDNLNK